jgi:hypothetical protein
MMICCLYNMIMITISEKIMKRSEIWDKCLHSSNQTNGQILCFIESFFSCAFTYFLVTSAQWPLLVISPSYVSTDEKYAWNFLLESQIVKYHWCWFITIWLHILSSRYEWLKLSIDAHCFNFPRGAHLLVHPYCTLYSSLKNPYMQLP